METGKSSPLEFHGPNEGTLPNTEK